MERTLILLKPDAVQRGLVGAVIQRFEQKGFKIVAAKLMQLSPELAAEHYAAHKGKSFYEPLVAFMTAAPIIAMVLEGVDAVRVTRAMMGATFGPDAESGTIRGDFGLSKGFNLVHGSDSVETAQREINLFFSPEEILPYDRPGEAWIYTAEDLEE